MREVEIRGAEWARDHGSRILARALVGVSAAFLVLTVPLWQPMASATSNGLFSVSPVSQTSHSSRPYFTPVLTPGVQVKDAVVVTNDSGQPITLDLYAADGRTARTGGFTIQPDFKPRRAMGAWIHLQTTVVTLPPGGSKVVPFTYTPPANAIPGDHAGGIVAAETTPEEVTGKNGVSINAIEAVGVPVYGRIKGPLQPGLAVSTVTLKVTRFIGSQFGLPVNVDVTYSITNTGNETLSPSVTASLSSVTGSSPTQHADLKRMLPGSTVTLSRRFDGVASLGSITAKIVARGDGVRATGTGGLVVVPWGLLGLVVVLLLLLVVFFVLRRRRHRRTSGDTAGGADEVGEEPSADEVPDESPSTTEDLPAHSRWW